MKYFSSILILSLCILGFLCMQGCGVSKEDIQNQVKSMLQEKFNTDKDISKYHLQVKRIDLTQESRNKYRGYAVVDYKNQEHNLGITVLYDGKSIMYETDPPAFLFQDAIQDAFGNWQYE